MGVGRVAGLGIDPGQGEGIVFRLAATGLRFWSAAGGAGLSARLPALRLAGIVCGRGAARTAGHLHSRAGAGVAGLATQSARATTTPFRFLRSPARTRPAVALRG